MGGEHPRGAPKKLTGAVDYWFGGGGNRRKELEESAAAYGVVLPEAAVKEQDYELWPENLSAVELFLRCSTQWRTGEPSRVAPAGVCGLDYAVVLALGRLYLPAEAEMRDVLEDLQVMEQRALELIYEAAQRERG